MDSASNNIIVAIVLMAIAIFDGHCKSHSNSMANELVMVSAIANGLPKIKNKTDDAATIVPKEPKFFDEFECK